MGIAYHRMIETFNFIEHTVIGYLRVQIQSQKPQPIEHQLENHRRRYRDITVVTVALFYFRQSQSPPAEILYATRDRFELACPD